MPVTVNNKADFKGMLLQVRNRPGQRYVFLLFRTDNGLRMCLSKNIELVASMRIGQKYRVRGQEYTAGDKTYLNMVTAKPLLSTAKMFKKRAGLLAAAASLLLVVGVGGTSALVHRNSQRNNQSNSPGDVNIQNTQDEKTPSTSSKISDIINQQSSDSSKPADTTITATPTPKPSNDVVKTNPTPPPVTATPSTPTAPPSDTSPPSTPSGLTANASGTSVLLNWSASDDNVEVTGYRIYRDGSLLASVGNILSYTDTSVSANTTYAYSVQAVDAAGNRSGNADASVQVGAQDAAPQGSDNKELGQ